MTTFQSLLPGGHYLGLAIFYVFDVAIIILVFAMLFRFLPEAKIAWRDVWTGAALTAILFMIGKFLLSTYLSSGVGLWRSQFVDHSTGLDFLFHADSALRRRVHQDLRQYLWLPCRAR